MSTPIARPVKLANKRWAVDITFSGRPLRNKTVFRTRREAQRVANGCAKRLAAGKRPSPENWGRVARQPLF